METSTTSSRTYSVPPLVELDAVGRDRDIAEITLDLVDPVIARSMLRDLAKGLSAANGVHWLRVIAAEPTGSPAQEAAINRVLDSSRRAFHLDLTLEAAQALHEQLGAVLERAETECRVDGCHAIGLLDGLCAADDERLDVRRAG